jgi:hypothetical protein
MTGYNTISQSITAKANSLDSGHTHSLDDGFDGGLDAATSRITLLRPKQLKQQQQVISITLEATAATHCGTTVNI